VEDAVEFSGRTVEDAVTQAETQLGTTRDDLDIEVLSAGSRGVFGIGAEVARIRVRRREEVPSSSREPVAAAAPAPAPASSQAPAPNGESRASGDLPDEATQVLSSLLHSMGFQAQVTVRNPDNPLTLGITGNNLGVLIGRRGDNLAALQFMVNLILSKHRRQWPRVVIDVENYRERREQSLRSLADRIAYRVHRNGKAYTLEAMPASDRRVIHLALRDRSDVETYSIGEGPARRVVVAPTRGATAPQMTSR
jgi:spoIIIJ-associated protein